MDKNIKTFEEFQFMGIGKPKSESIEFVSRLIKSYKDKKIQINPIHTNDNRSNKVILYETNFEGKNVRFNFHYNTFMTFIKDFDLLVDGEKIKTTPKQEKWIIKNIGLKDDDDKEWKPILRGHQSYRIAGF